MNRNGNLTEGSILRNIIRLAWPMMLGMLFQTLFNVVDAIYLGRYSSDAIAAVSFTFPVIFLIISLASGVGIGVTSLISRRLGANRKREADNAAEHGLILGIVLSIFFTIFGVIFAEPLFKFVGADAGLMPNILDYVRIIFSGSIFMFMAFMANSILRGEGDMKTPMKLMMIATIVNIILDPMMIFGFLFIPEMGVKGAAIATIISRAFSSIFGLSYLLSGKSLLKLKLNDFKFNFGIIKDIFKVGIPASLSQSITALGIFFMTKIVATYGGLAVAAYGIVARLDSVAVLPIIGITSATITIVGFNVGAKNFLRAEKTAWAAVKLGLVFGTVIGIIYFFGTNFFLNIFTNDPEIIGIGTAFLSTIALFTGYSAITIVISGAFQGTGKAYPSMILTFIRLFILTLPFAYFFGIYKGMGLSMIWWAFPFSGIVTSTLAMIWFKSVYNKIKKFKHVS